MLTLVFELAVPLAPEKETIPSGGQEQHLRDSRGRQKKTLEEPHMGMDSRNQEQFEVLRAQEERAFQQEDT